MPTTAGTGAKVTMAAVVSDERAGVKVSIIDPKLLPAAVALDPRLTRGLPPGVTVATGMDALTHAVEAYVFGMAYAQTDAWAVAATRLIVGNLEQAYRDGVDMAAREAMLLGSNLAGMAFTRAGVGYVHAIAHQFGALYHLPHGLANAIVLPYALDCSRPQCQHRLAQLARAAGLPGEGQSDDASAVAFVSRVRQLDAVLSIPRSVEALREADFERTVDRALAEAHGTYGVPRAHSVGRAQRPSQRRGRLDEALIATSRIVGLGLAIDTVYWFIEFESFHPAEALIVALLLAFLPYVILRGLATRIARP